jgi:hypothetical protein
MKKCPGVISILSLGLLAAACSNAPSPDARKGGTGAEPVASVHQADVGNSAWGYATVSADGIVDPNYSSPGTIAERGTVWRDGVTSIETGNYVVRIPNVSTGIIDDSIQGSVQVTARGTDNTRCQAFFGPQGNSPNPIFFTVQCVAPDGTPRDAPFVATFLRRTDFTGTEGGYIEVDPSWGFPQDFSPTAGATPYWTTHWNSTGEDIIVQQDSPGVYEVVFEGQDSFGGTAEVTALDFNLDGHYCEVSGWWWDNGNQDVWVYCFNALGEYDDSQFDLRWTQANPTMAGGYAYAYADNATPTSGYVPNLQYQSGFDGCNWTAPVTIEPYGPQPGGYLVHFPSLDTVAARGAVPMVSAQGGSGEYCKIGSWGAGQGSAYATVHCFDYTGQPTPAWFTIAYVVDRLLVC